MSHIEPSKWSTLTDYDVGVSFLLLRFAEDQGEVGEVVTETLLDQVKAAKAPAKSAKAGSLKTLADLQKELGASQDRLALEMLISGLQKLDSPDSLFELFRNLETIICRELVSASVMHSSGAFGQLARGLVLAFKQTSFEEIIKLYDAVQDFAQQSNCMGWCTSCTGSTVEVESAGQALPLSLPSLTSKDMVALRPAQDAQVTFLQYANSVQYKFADAAAFLVRCFHDDQRRLQGRLQGRPQNGTALAIHGVHEIHGIHGIQHAVLGLANLSLQMRNLEDALQALEDSIRAAQENSDANCLCASMYLLSLILCKMPNMSKMSSMAATLLRRCLYRSEALGLPLLESLSCMALATILAVPSFSLSRSPSCGDSVSVASNGASTGASNGGAFGALPLASLSSRPSPSSPSSASASWAWAFVGKVGAVGARSGTGLLGALSPAREVREGREVLAHVTLASLLSTQAGSLELLRPKVLLCQAGVSQVFALSSSAMCYQMALDIYKNRLAADDHALALCHIAEDASQTEALHSFLARELLCSRHVWVHVVGPKLGQRLLRQGQTAGIAAILFQTVGALGALGAFNAFDSDAKLRPQKFNNECRQHWGQLLATCQSAREGLDKGKDGKDGKEGHKKEKESLGLCESLLSLATLARALQGAPVFAVAPCIRCMTKTLRLRSFQPEALLCLAKLKLELGDVLGALQLAEETTSTITSHTDATGAGALAPSSVLAKAACLEADCLLELSSRQIDSIDCLDKRRSDRSDRSDHPSNTRKCLDSLFETVLERLGVALTCVSTTSSSDSSDSGDSSQQRRCHYLMARTCHELGKNLQRDRHASELRRLTESMPKMGVTLYPAF
ncbi:GIP [Symbiodinium natans]|uniref:Anaphase-promoting complex subunit 5 n=1 Tax=Symbiodinium natans TaxID=878477 RepID=A0A812HGK9_9DINO|nr:GIP [Symbiodinium natans]